MSAAGCWASRSSGARSDRGRRLHAVLGFLILAIAVERVLTSCSPSRAGSEERRSADQRQRARLVELAQRILHPPRDELVARVGVAAGAAELLALVDRREHLD